MNKILVIEDESKLRETIVEYLSLTGYEVFEAQNGFEGLEKLNQNIPDIIICDVMMPVLDGYGFIELLKQTNYSDIPVLFLTAKTELTDYEKGIELGAKAYILKPFTFKDLKRIVDHHLKHK